ncbi:hypothetical protein HMPREF6745_1414 [Prevotella sp. oral taxon 472 str. F0295]|nr:hypothetical protein HMPREF6745_1414 [Prevotella sp. oral taxon 472 str. F0295]
MAGKQVVREREMKSGGVKRRKDDAKKIAHTIKPISHVLSLHAYAPFRFRNNKRTIIAMLGMFRHNRKRGLGETRTRVNEKR